MIDKKEMVKLVVEFNLRHGYLLHGASMVMHGVKDQTNDIDILIHTKYIDRLEFSSKKAQKFDFGFGSVRNTIDYVLIDGFQCQTLESIIKEKRQLGRPKDLEAIELIEAFIAKGNLPKSYQSIYRKVVMDY